MGSAEGLERCQGGGGSVWPQAGAESPRGSQARPGRRSRKQGDEPESQALPETAVVVGPGPCGESPPCQVTHAGSQPAGLPLGGWNRHRPHVTPLDAGLTEEKPRRGSVWGGPGGRDLPREPFA